MTAAAHSGALAVLAAWAAAAAVAPLVVRSESPAGRLGATLAWTGALAGARGAVLPARPGAGRRSSPSVATIVLIAASIREARIRRAGLGPVASGSSQMSMLKNLESKIAGLVEGTFSRAFRSEVRPVEIARKLTREMDEHRSPSLSRVYVPNEYAVWLSPPDRERFADYEDALKTELSGYLLEHARGERFSLLSRPVIEFKTDERLQLGEFGIQARLVHAEEPIGQAPRAVQGDSGHTMVYSAAERLSEPLEERARTRQSSAALTVEGQRMPIGAGRRHPRALAGVRRPALRRERLAPPRRDPPARRRLGADRPRLDQRRLGQRRAGRPPAGALPGRRDRARHHPRHVRPRSSPCSIRSRSR